jgi:hypothetical protein
VRMDYGRLLRCHHTDWIFLLFQYFLTLKEVTFVLGTNGQLVDRNFSGSGGVVFEMLRGRQRIAEWKILRKETLGCC